MFGIQKEKTDLITIRQAYPLQNNALNTINVQWPLQGQGWYMMLLEFIHTIVIGTGTGAKSLGELNIQKNVNFSCGVDADTHDAAGHGLFRIGQAKMETAPYSDAIAAANGTYRVMVPLFFADPWLPTPEDTILDTGRYDDVALNIMLGGLSDLYTSPGTATLASTLNISVLRTKNKLPLHMKPRALPYYKGLPILDPQTNAQILLSRENTLRYLQLFWMTMNTITAGQSFSGTPATNVLKDVTIRDSKNYYLQSVLVNSLQMYIKKTYSLETVPAGYFLHNFIEGADLEDGVLADPKQITDPALSWTLDTPSTSGVSAILCGARDLKPGPAKEF